jgi:hypothetical protein
MQVSSSTLNGKKTISIDLNDYIADMEEVEVPPGDPSTPLNPDQISSLRGGVGELLWVSSQTRPDVSFRVSLLASTTADPQIKDLTETNRIMKKAKKQNFKIHFPEMKGKIRMKVFTDSAFQNRPDGSTQGGGIILLQDEEGTCAPISWFSKRLRRVARSTLAGETLGILDGIDEAIFLAYIYNEIIGNGHQIPIDIYTDAKSVYDYLQSGGGKTVEKRVKTDLASVLEDLKNGIVASIHWVISEEQLADALTKDMVPKFLINVLETNKLTITEGKDRRAIIGKFPPQKTAAEHKKEKTSVEIRSALTLASMTTLPSSTPSDRLSGFEVTGQVNWG